MAEARSNVPGLMADSTVCIGRGRELAQVWEQLGIALRLRARAVVVTGEPGIGKTRLLTEVTARATHAGLTVLHGGASEAAGMPPYLPFLEALGHYIRTTPTEVLRERVGADATLLASLFPELSARLEPLPAIYPLPADQARLRLYQAVGAFLATIAEDGLVLIFDDLQWVDSSSLDLIAHVVRQQPTARLLFLIACRAGDIALNSALERTLAELNHLRVLTTLALAPLVEAEITALAAAYLGGPVEPATSRLLHAHSEGNPFFAEELLHAWVESGALTQPGSGAAWTLTLPLQETLPASIASAIRLRLIRLAPEVVDQLRVASVIGGTFDVNLLAQVQNADPDAIEEHLLAAERAGLVRGDRTGRYIFSHEKVRECLYSEVSSTRRQTLHGQIGLALETDHSAEDARRLADLAFHFANSRDSERGVHYLQRAAAEALRIFAPQQALAHLQMALLLLNHDAPQRGALLLALGEAALMAADESAAGAAFTEAQTWFVRQGDCVSAARALYGCGILLLARYTYALDAVGNRVSVQEIVRQPADEVPHGPGDVVVTVLDTTGAPEVGLNVYAFAGTTYAGVNGTTDASGQVTLTLEEGDYRFRADKNGTQFWSGADNTCAVPSCTADDVTTTIPAVVAVQDSAGTPEVGLKVYAFKGTTYAGYNKTTDAAGLVTFTLPVGDYRFRADKNGTQFWSGVENTCTLPGCASDTVTTTIPVVVTINDSDSTPEVGLKVYTFDGTTYSSYNKTTDAAGLVTFTLPFGNYRFRADKAGTQYWSGAANHCTVPGCTAAAITTALHTIVTVQDSSGNSEAGLHVYAFDGTTYSGYNGTTDVAGHVTFTLPFGNYRFRADKNGTQFWSGAANHCTVPGCTAAAITTALHTVVTVQDSSGNPEVGLRVYAFDGTMYSGYNRTTDAAGLVTFTLPFGDYRFRADKNGTQFWSGAANHCTVPGCTAATITTALHTIVTVQDSSGNPEVGLKVYAFNGATYAGYNGATDAGGHVTFTLPFGDYRFRADKNGTQFWSGAENTCALPGCASDTVTTTIPVLVTVRDSAGEPEAGLPVYAFDGTTYSGYNKTTDASGWATFTLPFGDYRFRADKNGTQYWSDTENHCTLPGCTSAVVTTTVQAGLLGRGKTFAAPLPWAWDTASLPNTTIPIPLQDNASGDLVTRTITYTYDPLNRLTEADYSTGETYAYQYDAVGNRAAMTDTTGTTTYTYDDANRLTSVDGVTYTWDARGNLTHDGVYTYTYNAAGRMVQAESITATLVYTYTADGLRVAQAVAGDVSTFVWDWATGVPEMLGDGNNLYLIGYDTLGWDDGDSWTFVLPDALGSVRQEIDATGAVTAVREWSPYGEEIGGAQEGLGFTGEWFDTGLGLQYLRARWYQPRTGLFWSCDPVVSEPSYQYVRGNPVNLIDPSGHTPMWWEAGRSKHYSCKCGWIDEQHAAEAASWGWDKISAGKGEAINGWFPFNTDGGLRAPTVSYMLAEFEVRETVREPEQVSVALGMFIAYNNFWEEFQGANLNPLVAQSRFSADDLVSNLIGFYRVFDGNNLAYYMDICGVVGYKEFYNSDRQMYIKLQRKIWLQYVTENGLFGLKWDQWGVRPPQRWSGNIQNISRFGECSVDNVFECDPATEQLPEDLVRNTPQSPGENWRWTSGKWDLSDYIYNYGGVPYVQERSMLFDAEELNRRPLNWRGP